jgi:3-hydroxyisobutyrate dehydrogenase-like beta-hydroxyacid dehydrogenase
MLDALQAQADAAGLLDWDLHFVDASVIRGHQHAAGARRTGAVGG